MTTLDAGVNDSQSVGDPARFRTHAELEAGLRAMHAPREAGRIEAIVRRGENGRRESMQHAQLSSELGLPGDAWGRDPERDPAMQLAVMQLDVAELIANGQPLTLFGDNLFVSLDLSSANLPAGSRLRAGGITFEVTPMPHNGCRKFQARFGADALRFVCTQALRHFNLRGIYLRVVEAGEVRCGDAITVVSG